MALEKKALCRIQEAHRAHGEHVAKCSLCQDPREEVAVSCVDSAELGGMALGMELLAMTLGVPHSKVYAAVQAALKPDSMAVKMQRMIREGMAGKRPESEHCKEYDALVGVAGAILEMELCPPSEVSSVSEADLLALAFAVAERWAMPVDSQLANIVLDAADAVA